MNVYGGRAAGHRFPSATPGAGKSPLVWSGKMKARDFGPFENI